MPESASSTKLKSHLSSALTQNVPSPFVCTLLSRLVSSTIPLIPCDICFFVGPLSRKLIGLKGSSLLYSSSVPLYLASSTESYRIARRELISPCAACQWQFILKCGQDIVNRDDVVPGQLLGKTFSGSVEISEQ